MKFYLLIDLQFAINNLKLQSEANNKLKKAMHQECIAVNKKQEIYRKLSNTNPFKLF